MKKAYKLLCVIIIFMMTLGAFGTYAYASNADFTEDSSDYYECIIIDEADLLSDEEENKLMERMLELSKYGNIIFSTVTLPDGDDYESKSETRYHELFRKERGIHFQIDKGNRKFSMFASDDLKKKLGHEKDSIVKNFNKKLKNADYLATTIECFDQVEKAFSDERIAHEMKYTVSAIMALMFGLVINFILVFITMMEKKRKKALLGDVRVDWNLSNIKINDKN